MSVTVSFLQATEDDLKWLIRSHDEIYREEFAFNEEFGLVIAEKVSRMTSNANPFTSIWIAWVNETRAGSVAISEIESGVAFINFLLVLKHHRGLGLSRQLIDLTLSRARTHGFSRVRLETFGVLEVARRLYQKMGFKLCEPVRDLDRFGPVVKQEFYELVLD